MTTAVLALVAEARSQLRSRRAKSPTGEEARAAGAQHRSGITPVRRRSRGARGATLREREARGGRVTGGVRDPDQQERALPLRVDLDLIGLQRRIRQAVLGLDPKPLLRVHAVLGLEDRGG